MESRYDYIIIVCRLKNSDRGTYWLMISVKWKHKETTRNKIEKWRDLVIIEQPQIWDVSSIP